MAKKRGRETAYDMVLSLGAVFIAVAVVLVIAWRPKQDVVQSVDYEAAKATAVSSSNWPIYVPAELPKDLQVTSARFEAESYGDAGDSRWFLGLTGNDETYISLWQSDGSVKKVTSAATNNGLCSETEVIAGSTWDKCAAAKPETRAYVRVDGDLIYVVSGTADWSELKDFINSLVVAN